MITTRKRSTTAWLLATALCLAPLGGLQATKLYKWVDEAGQVHYTQTPPAAGQVQEMRLPRSMVETPVQEEAKDEEDLPEPVKAMREIRQQNCQAAQQNLQIYRDSDLIRQSDGSVVELDAATRAAKIAESEAMIREFCR